MDVEVLGSALKALLPDLVKRQPAEPRASMACAARIALGGVPSDALKNLLAEQLSQLLRTLERKDSADSSSNTAECPAFPAPTSTAPSNMHVRACSLLLQLDEAATLKLLPSKQRTMTRKPCAKPTRRHCQHPRPWPLQHSPWGAHLPWPRSSAPQPLPRLPLLPWPLSRYPGVPHRHPPLSPGFRDTYIISTSQ